MQKVTYKSLKSLINIWNEDHPECQFRLTAYSGAYHLENPITGNIILADERPGKLLELFNAWKNGYFVGKYAVLTMLKAKIFKESENEQA